MLQVFHLDAVKIDLGIAHIVVEPICSCWACLQARGCRGGTMVRGHEACAGHERRRPQCEHGTWCGHGTRSDMGPHVKQAQQVQASGR
jgi:hypothetical protein